MLLLLGVFVLVFVNGVFDISCVSEVFVNGVMPFIIISLCR